MPFDVDSSKLYRLLCVLFTHHAHVNNFLTLLHILWFSFPRDVGPQLKIEIIIKLKNIFSVEFNEVLVSLSSFHNDDHIDSLGYPQS